MLLKILSLAREIGAGKVNKVLGMSDFKLAMTALEGQRSGADPRAFSRSSWRVADNADPEELATQIDACMALLVTGGVDDAAIFARMADCLPAVVHLTNEGKLEILCERHPGLDCYEKLIEQAAADLSAALKHTPRFQ